MLTGSAILLALCLIVVIGLFGVGEILLSMEEGLAFEGKHAKINGRPGSPTPNPE